MTEYATNEERTIPPFGVEVGTFADINNMFPIPINAIDLSGGILIQNPGFQYILIVF